MYFPHFNMHFPYFPNPNSLHRKWNAYTLNTRPDLKNMRVCVSDTPPLNRNANSCAKLPIPFSIFQKKSTVFNR